MLFKKRSKKGLSHVDWAMSLAIFLLYLAWFFIFVKPLFYPTHSMDVLLDILDDGVEGALFQDVERVRIMVADDTGSDHEPVIIPFDYDWSTNEIAHSADHFVIDEGKLFFIANLSNTSMFSMLYPHKALKLTPLFPIIANEERVWMGDFIAHFDEHLLERVEFRNDPRLLWFSVEVDGNELDTDGEFTNSTLFAKYKREDDLVNLSSYVMSENSNIYSYLTPADFRNHSVVIEFGAYNYTYFYLSPADRGEIRYSIGVPCKYYTSDFLDLYDAGSGMLVTFDRDITFRLCANETNPSVRVEFDTYVGREENFNIYFHDGGADSVLDYPVEPVVGVTETLRTVSSKQVSLMKNRDYDYLKQVFGYPEDRDFNITVSSSVVSASYGIPQPDIADVYARKMEGVMLDERFEPVRALIMMNVW